MLNSAIQANGRGFGDAAVVDIQYLVIVNSKQKRRTEASCFNLKTDKTVKLLDLKQSKLLDGQRRKLFCHRRRLHSSRPTPRCLPLSRL
jgi:hypothetical protein